MHVQRRFDFQLAGALKIQLKRGSFQNPLWHWLSGFFNAREKG